MTVKAMLSAMCDANDAQTPKVGVYEASIVHATRRRNGDVVFTLKLVTTDFTVDDVLRGVKGWVALGSITALRRLQEPAPPAPEQTTEGTA